MRLFVLLVILLAGATFPPVVAAEPTRSTTDPSILRRVRTEDARVREALAQGVARSAAFRDVLRRVESRDVIVYIEMDQQLRSRLAGRMRWVISTRTARYVRVSLNPELTGVHFIATLAHELEHVAEVGEEASVVSERTLASFYRHVGSERGPNTGAWDTEAAQVTGEVVRREFAANTTFNGTSPLLIGRAAPGQR